MSAVVAEKNCFHFFIDTDIQFQKISVGQAWTWNFFKTIKKYVWNNQIIIIKPKIDTGMMKFTYLFSITY